MRVLILVLLLFIPTQSVAAGSENRYMSSASETDKAIGEVRQSARTNLLAAERVLFAAKKAIDEASIILSAIDNKELIHRELKRIATSVPGARAIIVIGPDGRLLHDSFRYPAIELDLSDRPYFRDAVSKTDFLVGQQLVGRTSNTSFVPLTKRYGDNTIVAVTAPFSLVDLQTECGECWSLVIQKSGGLVTVFPPEADVSSSLVNATSKSKAKTGTQVMRYAGSVIAVGWRQSADFPIVSVAVRGMPDSASVDADVN
jgi:hypothetical protein